MHLCFVFKPIDYLPQTNIFEMSLSSRINNLFAIHVLSKEFPSEFRNYKIIWNELATCLEREIEYLSLECKDLCVKYLLAKEELAIAQTQGSATDRLIELKDKRYNRWKTRLNKLVELKKEHAEFRSVAANL